jgi:PAS domain S-box-containing protein
MLKRLDNIFVSSKTEKLHFSELRYRRLFETAQDGILILDAYSGKITDANPFLKNLLGYTDAELLGKELWEIGVFKDTAESKTAFRLLQKKGYIRYKDLPLQTKDGRRVDVEFVSNAYMVDTQKVIQCNIRDITDRRKAEILAKSRAEELERVSKSQKQTSRALLNVMEDLRDAKTLIEIEKVKDEAMLASIGDGLIAVDSDLKVMIINKSAEKMLGWKMKDMVGKEITNLPLEDEDGTPLPLHKRPTQIALKTGKTVSTNYFCVRKDKTRFPIAISVTPIKLEGKIIGALDIFRDITKEKEIDKAKSEFVSLASHQLRTPLGIIKWYLEK